MRWKAIYLVLRRPAGDLCTYLPYAWNGVRRQGTSHLSPSVFTCCDIHVELIEVARSCPVARAFLHGGL